MMNDRARLWSKRKSAPFADPRDEERALREMRKSIDHSFNFNIDFKGEQPYMDNYRATVSFGAGCWQNTGTRRRADVPQQQERQHSILVSRPGLHSGLPVLSGGLLLPPGPEEKPGSAVPSGGGDPSRFRKQRDHHFQSVHIRLPGG